MNAAVRVTLTRGDNVQVQCLATPYPNKGWQDAVAELDAQLGHGHAQLQAQSTAAKDASTALRAKKAAKAKLLDDHLEPVLVIARGHEVTDPVFARRFRSPRPRGSEAAFIVNTKTVADDAEKARDLFIKDGLPETFVEDLRAAIATYEAAVKAVVTARAARVGATADLEKTAVKIEAVLKRLDAITTIRYRANPDALAAWKSALRVPKPARRTPATATPPAATPAPAAGATRSA